mmetsp:Transcript_25303/g.51501  ORF Transcript_25303/g.51501 Transcript_25303/m.51501 type:complete len:229 (-) Transcript_25303:313-999(-)
MRIATLNESGAAAFATASGAWSREKRWVMRPCTDTRLLSSSFSDSENGPHRDPMSVISSTTTLVKLALVLPANVDFITIVPLARVKFNAESNPSAEPVQSTTRENFLPSASTSPTSAVFKPLSWKRGNASVLRPSTSTSVWVDAIACAIMMPSLPVPTTATESSCLKWNCCRIWHAAASGSVNIASSSESDGGTRWRLMSGTTTNSAKHPSALKMPIAARSGCCARSW